jgi:signal peptide peptidase SppA
MKTIPAPLLAPWAITPAGLELVVGVWSRGEIYADRVVEALQAREGQPLQNTHAVDVRGGVAIIPVCGPLMRHADMFSAISGATSYETLRKDLQTALDDRSVNAILLDVDSPGGEVHGCGELSAALFAARGKKPIRAYVSGTCASAAYWIASACDEIVIDASAMVGSIGVRTLLVDGSKADELAGVKQYNIVSSQSPFKVVNPSVEADRERVLETVNAMAAVFVGDVARNRGVAAERVLKSYGRGDVMIGRDAVEAGLADRIGDFESVLAGLSAARLTYQTGAGSMAKGDYSEEECDECMDSRAGANVALGLDAKATVEQVKARAVALVEFERHLVEMTGVKTAAEAVGKVATAMADAAQLAGVRAELATVAAEGIKRDLRATLESGFDKKKLSLGAIQKSVPMVLRGEQKKAWISAMGALEAVTRDTVIDAACSVAISSDDLAAIGEFSKSASPIAADPFVEPARDSNAESEELDGLSQQIKAAADATRKSLDRGVKPASSK